MKNGESSLLASKGIKLNSAFVLAPLAGYSDLPFRLLCKEQGAGMVFSEMISANGLVQGQKKTRDMLQTTAAERPFGVQLFGAEPSVLAEAAAMLAALPIDAIDLNMGCPVRKVVRKGAGAALMKDMRRAEAIISAVCRQSKAPVMVKFRSGWDNATINATEFACMAEAAGAAALSIHARTSTQAFGGKADWSIIRAVKEAVRIGVIGNGDVLSRQDGLAMMAKTGCDGVMIGRGALTNPWIFSAQSRPETLNARMPVLLRYVLLVDDFSCSKLLFKAKNQLAKLLSGLETASIYRQTLLGCASIQELKTCLRQWAASTN